MTSIKKEIKRLSKDRNFLENPWASLAEELNHWEEEGVMAEFWWRDDDAIKDGPQLRNLIAYAEETPIVLAVIPALLEESLQPILEENLNLSVVQHGYAHINHAAEGNKKAEFQDHRPARVMATELYEGAEILRNAFQGQFLPMFVPPWNRIGERAKDSLKEIGIDFLSTSTAREPFDGPYIINTHVDPVNWKEGSVFLGEAQSLAQVLAHLKAKRLVWEGVDVIEPTGFLTHHAIHDEETWKFINKFHRFVHNHTQAGWLSLPQYISSFFY